MGALGVVEHPDVVGGISTGILQSEVKLAVNPKTHFTTVTNSDRFIVIPVGV